MNNIARIIEDARKACISVIRIGFVVITVVFGLIAVCAMLFVDFIDDEL